MVIEYSQSAAVMSRQHFILSFFFFIALQSVSVSLSISISPCLSHSSYLTLSIWLSVFLEPFQSVSFSLYSPKWVRVIYMGPLYKIFCWMVWLSNANFSYRFSPRRSSKMRSINHWIIPIDNNEQKQIFSFVASRDSEEKGLCIFQWHLSRTDWKASWIERCGINLSAATCHTDYEYKKLVRLHRHLYALCCHWNWIRSDGMGWDGHRLWFHFVYLSDNMLKIYNWRKLA